MNPTHEVFNQPAPLSDYNLFDTNRPLRDALKFNAPALDTAELGRLGATLGSSVMQTHARLANVHGPVLHSHDRFGRRVDQVEFHPELSRADEAGDGRGFAWHAVGEPSP
jgi:putative acyl-CoA dehydrogenase